MRQGIGSILLNIIIEDAKREGVKFLHTNPTTGYMENFCKKNGFEEHLHYDYIKEI